MYSYAKCLFFMGWGGGDERGRGGRVVTFIDLTTNGLKRQDSTKFAKHCKHKNQF